MIALRKNADRRVRQGHLWVFSNEIQDPPVSELEPGSIHELYDSGREFLGMAYANPASLIAARILSRRKVTVDGDFLRARIQSALDLRKRLYPNKEVFRWVFAESDLLPGLLVDRYGSVLAVQSLTAGMDKLLEQVLEILVEMVAPQGIYLRNDSPSRELEGIPLEKKLAFGSVPDKVPMESGGLQFVVDVQNGQKTGFFLDQEANRMVVDRCVFPAARVLDLFCYSGAFGIRAAAAGAGLVTCVDSSRGALALAQACAESNGLSDRVMTVRESVVDFLKKTRETWDLVVLDPPAFIKSRSRIEEGKKGYIDVNRRALGKLGSGGILVTCSCSHHMDNVAFEEMLTSASRQSGKQLRILDVRGQAPDHPVLLSMPETRYLKVIVAQVL